MYNFYFEHLLNNDPDKTITERSYKLRKKLNPYVRMALPKFSDLNLVVEKKGNIPDNIPIIFTPTHSFKYDILYVLRAIDTHAYILFGSLPQFFHTFDGVSSWLYGVILVDRMDKESRAASKLKIGKVLDMGGKVIDFVEGAWNKTPNKPAEKIFPGVYDLATNHGAWVVPMATHVEGDTCYVSIDDAFDISQYDKEEGIKVLRDKMATLKWELIEKYSKASRKDFDNGIPMDEQWQQFLNKRISEVQYYVTEVENNANFKDKTVTAPDEVFKPLEQIELTPQNCKVLSRIRRLGR